MIALVLRFKLRLFSLSAEACEPESVFQQRDINRHSTISHPAFKTSGAALANFQSNHSTPSQGHLFAQESYHSSHSNSPILSPKFASTPVPESAHEPPGECVRHLPQPWQQRRSDSAYLSDQSVQETFEPEGPICGDEIQHSHFSAKPYAETQDESAARIPQRHRILIGRALKRDVPVLLASPDMDIDDLLCAGESLLVIRSYGKCSLEPSRPSFFSLPASEKKLGRLGSRLW